MKSFLILICWFGSLSGSEIPQLFFRTADLQELSAIRQEMPNFYAQELLEAGLFKDINESLKAAIEECNIEDPSKTLYYYCLFSKESETKYGYLVYSIKDKIAYLEAIHLDSKYRGLGLGKQVLQNFEAELKEKDLEAIWLYVFAHNQPAVQLYQKMGYSIESTYSNNDKLIGYQMQKKL